MATLSYEELLFNAIKNGQQEVRSVYDIWLELGNEGTPQDFLDSLKGTSAIIVSGTTIPASDWVSSDGVYKVTISNENITSSSIVNVSFESASLSVAASSGVLGFTSTLDGAFEMCASSQPTSDLVIDYAIINE